MTRPALIFIALLLSGCASSTTPEIPQAQESKHNWQFTEVDSDEPFGSRVFSVTAEAPVSISGYLDWVWRLDEFNTVGMLHIAADGTIQPLLAGYEYDDQHYGGGKDLIHVGTPAGAVGTPTILAADDMHVQTWYEGQRDVGNGWIIMYWANLNAPIYWNATFFGAGISMVPLPEAPVISFTHRSGDSGFHVSSPSPMVAAMDGIFLGGSGASVITSMRVLVSDAGAGSLALSGQELDEMVSLNGADYIESNCVACFHALRVAAYDPAAIRLGLDYAGNNGQTKILGAAVMFSSPLIEKPGFYLEQTL